jgi:hypothetical protein
LLAPLFEEKNKSRAPSPSPPTDTRRPAREKKTSKKTNKKIAEMEADDPSGPPPYFTLMFTGQIESADLPPAASVSATLMPWPLPQLSAALFRPLAPAMPTPTTPTTSPALPRSPHTHAPGSAYCRFEIVAGEDWALVDGHDGGTTQLARPGRRVGTGVGAAEATPASESSFGSGGSDCSTTTTTTVAWNHPLEIAFRSATPFGWPQLTLAVYGVDPATGRDVPRGYGGAPLPTAAGRHHLKVRLFRPRAATLFGAAAGWGSGRLAEFADARLPSYGEGREGEFLFLLFFRGRGRARARRRPPPVPDRR